MTNMTIFALFSYIAIVCAILKPTQCDEYLSNDVEPVSYDLKITPDFKTFKFSGKVNILIRVKFPTNVIKLHCKNFKMKDVSTQEEEIPNTVPVEVEWSQTNDFCVCTASKPLELGSSYILTIKYEGSLKEDTKGLFRTSYEVNGQKKWLVATNFYGTYAREAFPCFDEPRFRTPFTISIARNKNQRVISNMPFVESQPHSDKTLVWDTFRKSQPIPTYSVAFVVSEYSHLPETRSLIEIETRPSIISNAEHALKQSEKILTRLENFIGIPYELPKLSIATVPKIQYDLADHWGLYIMSEEFVIADERKISHFQDIEITASICHLFSRHWFGGQVTPASWDYSWLTEAFAGYMEFFVTDLVEPSWNLDYVFNIEILQSALWNELANPGALRSMKTSNSQINRKYGSINYHKGASIIRMLEHMISRSSLRSAIQRYITDSKKSRNGLVTPNELFEALKYQSDIDSFPMPPHISIVDVMKIWTENIGYPVIIVKRNDLNQIIEIEQRTYNPRQTSVTPPDQEWITPISYTTKSKAMFSNTTPLEWVLGAKKITLSVSFESNEWIIFNLQRSGYYRVNYDCQNWNLLIAELKGNMEKIHVLNRAQLIDDSFTFAFEGDLAYDVPLKMGEYLEKETSMIPLLSAIFHLDMLYKKYEDTASRVFFCMYIKKILEKQIQLIGFDIKSTDSHLTRMGKPSLLLLACKIGLPSCVEKALSEYNTYISDLSNVQPDLQEVVFCTALRESKDEESVYKNLWIVYHASDISYDKIIILKTLGCSRNENILKKTLLKLFDQKDNDIDKMHEKYVYDSILSSSSGITATLKFVRERIAEISQFSTDDLATMKTIFGLLEPKVHSIEHLRILRAIKEEFAKLESNKYEDLLNIIQRTKTSGIKLAKENNKMSDILKPIFHEVLNIPPPKIPEKQTSQAFTLIPSLFLCFVCLIFYNLC